MHKWKSKHIGLPRINTTVWAYGCDGNIYKVCKIWSKNVQYSQWDLDHKHCWMVLERSRKYEEGSVLPLQFITHWKLNSYDGKSEEPYPPVVRT